MAIPIFYSYSHKDELFRETLETHLSILKRQGYIDGWQDRRIAPGDNWEEEINLNLQSAKIILLLVSSNFLASDYCYDSETILALEQHEKKDCVVIPVILKPCLWTNSHFKHLQALPKDGKPITTWKNEDEAWLDVAEGVLRIVENLGKDISVIGDNNLDKTDNPKGSIHDELSRNIIMFLKTFDKWYFSPLRIQKWGGKQTDFEDLSKFDINSIRYELERLKKKEIVKTILSQKGNEIFKLK